MYTMILDFAKKYVCKLLAALKCEGQRSWGIWQYATYYFDHITIMMFIFVITIAKWKTSNINSWSCCGMVLTWKWRISTMILTLCKRTFCILY